MKKKKALPSLLYLVFIVLFPWGVSSSFNKCLELWIKNWWNTRQSETLLTDIQEKRILERFIELEELSLLDEMIKGKLKTHFSSNSRYMFEILGLFCLNRLFPSLVVIYHSISEA
ncbi:hypothetical protein ACQJBY_059595 [Aegilops geniculata]